MSLCDVTELVKYACNCSTNAACKSFILKWLTNLFSE